MPELTLRKNNMASASSIDVIANDITYIKRDVADIKSKLEADYVTLDQFEPIRNVVYGMVGIILTGVIGAVVALVVRQP